MFYVYSKIMYMSCNCYCQNCFVPSLTAIVKPNGNTLKFSSSIKIIIQLLIQ